jgi:serine protease Do
MFKKQTTLFLVFNVFLVFLGCIILRWILNNKINSIWVYIESHIGSQVNDIKTSSLLALQSSLVHTIANAKQSVVSISISKDIRFYIEDPSQLNWPWNIQQQTAKIWWGSGIIVSKQWYIITNKHVIQDTTAKYSVTLYNGKAYNVDKIWFDDLLDLAILKIIDSTWKTPVDLVPASFLPLATQVDIWQFVLVMGNSLSTYANSVTMGIIWGKNKQLTINKNNLYIWLYQTDALVNPGNSGGPFLDIEGNVLGITTAIVEWQWIAFALPLSQEFLSWTMRSIEKFWSISRPIIGIQYMDITSTLKEEKHIVVDSWIYVTDVLTDLPAWQAWLKIGDVIVRIDATPITRQLPFLYQLYTHIPGDHISLDVIRNGENIALDLVLGSPQQ